MSPDWSIFITPAAESSSSPTTRPTVLLCLFLPDRLTFAIDPRIAPLWWVRAFLRFADVLQIDPAKPFSYPQLPTSKAILSAARR
jgi:hypothetical protein